MRRVGKSAAALAALALAMSPAVAHAARSVYVGIWERYPDGSFNTAVRQYDVDPSGGALTPKNPPSLSKAAPALAVTPNGKHLYVGDGRCSNDICQADINPQDGSLALTTAGGGFCGGSSAGVQFMAVRPDGRSAYCATDGIDTTIHQFDIDPVTGNLSDKSPPFVYTGNRDHHMVITPDGKSLYIAVEDGNIHQYDIDASGQLTPKTPAYVPGGNYALPLAVTPDGKNLYALDAQGRFTPPDVRQYSIDPTTGSLSPKSPAVVPLDNSAGPGDIAASPDSRTIYVTDSSNGQVLQFDVAPANGTLTPKTPASVSTGGYRATYIVVDGTDAYVLDIGINQPEPNNYAISQFDVEPASGALTPKPDRDIALASELAPLGIILAPSQGYPRSKGASPFRASLVPAYRACTTANDTHGAPLSSPSCTPPTLASDFLTVGTPDANDAAASSVGFVQLKTVVNPAPAPNDVAIDIGTTDVRCTLPPSTTCGNANSVAGPDYTGHLQAIETLQVSDQENGAVTVAAYDFKQTVPCAATADMSIGASCSVSTSANTLVPGLVMKGARATWQLGQVRLYDGGASGTAGASDATLFEDQGVFVP